METAMYQAHGISYSEYESDMDARIRIEQKRDEEYQQSLVFASEVDNKL